MTAISPTNITASHIADWFLARAKEDGKSLKPMKLQKLVYFAYGWYFAYFDKPLFPETIYAFRHGPVVKELYDRFKPFKGKPITENVTPTKLDAQLELLLDSVWKAYEPFSDIQLSETTHSHPPWIDAYSSEELFAVMSPESIRDHFKPKIKKQTHA